MKENLPPIPVLKYAVCPSCTKIITLHENEISIEVIARSNFINLNCECGMGCFVSEKFTATSESKAKDKALKYLVTLDLIKDEKIEEALGDIEILEEEIENLKRISKKDRDKAVKANSVVYAVKKYFKDIIVFAENKAKDPKLKLTNKVQCSNIIKEAKEAIKLLSK